jgi:hypothetical protein
MNSVRREYGLRSSKQFPFRIRHWPRYPRELKRNARLFSVQISAQTIFGTATFLLAALSWVLACQLFQHTPRPELRILSVAFSLASSVYALRVGGPLACLFGSSGFCVGWTVRFLRDGRVLNEGEGGRSRW